MKNKNLLSILFLGVMMMMTNPTSSQNPTSNATPTTPENKLIMLRNAMSEAKTNNQKKAILKQIGETGTFLGMVYSADFLNNKALQRTAANAVINIALTHQEYNGENTRELLKKLLDNKSFRLSNRTRKAIQQYLEKSKAEEAGFVRIFNGKDLTGWKGLVGNPIKRAQMDVSELAKAQVKADEAMRNDWKVIDGLLTYVGNGYDNICTTEQYGDFEMYVDWKLDSNGKEPDAGIYLRGTPQVQIWDIARVNVGAQVGSGGLYNNKINRSTPTKVADNKLGEWNSFYIKMKGNYVTVFLNGEKVVDNIVMENYWDRKQPIFPKEQIELQAHGSKVYFRDIYIKKLD